MIKMTVFFIYRFNIKFSAIHFTLINKVVKQPYYLKNHYNGLGAEDLVLSSAF